MSANAMSRTPIGEAAMSDAERQQRRRDRAKALRDAAPPPDGLAVPTNGSEPDVVAAAPIGKPGPADYPRMLYHQDGRTIIAATPEQHDRLKPDGWEKAPLAVRRQRPVTHHGSSAQTTIPSWRPFAR